MSIEPPKLSTFPLDRPFVQQPAITQLSEVGLRLVKNFFETDSEVLGTATLIARNLALTAKHVLQGPNGEVSIGADDSISLAQVWGDSEESEYAVWSVTNATLHPSTDLALLNLDPSPHLSGGSAPNRFPILRATPPANGCSVAGFGYRRSEIKMSNNAEGGKHIALSDAPMVGVGCVVEHLPQGRDSSLLPYPCFRVDAPFDLGMSGGPVFDETGMLCGIISRGYARSEDDEANPAAATEYVATLFPLLGLRTQQDRGPDFPAGAWYPVIDLARKGHIKLYDLIAISRLFPTA